MVSIVASIVISKFLHYIILVTMSSKNFFQQNFNLKMTRIQHGVGSWMLFSIVEKGLVACSWRMLCVKWTVANKRHNLHWLFISEWKCRQQVHGLSFATQKLSDVLKAYIFSLKWMADVHYGAYWYTFHFTASYFSWQNSALFTDWGMIQPITELVEHLHYDLLGLVVHIFENFIQF
jgi:hypothetical protein